MLEMTYWTSYKLISSKLKRRFMRKPNYGEATEGFLQIANQASKEGCQQIAAFCYLAVARCQEAMGDTNEEAHYTLKAGQMHLSEVKLDTICSYHIFSENIPDAINAYLLAVDLYKQAKMSSYAISLLCELASALEYLDCDGEAVIYYEKCLELKSTAVSTVNVLKRLWQCKFRIDDFDGAIIVLSNLFKFVTESCKNYNEVNYIEFGHSNFDCITFEDALLESEISRLLLVLLLKPSPQHLSQAHKHILEKYAPDVGEPPFKEMNSEIFYLLQSFCNALTEYEEEFYAELEILLLEYLSPIQNEMVVKILQQYQKQLD